MFVSLGILLLFTVMGWALFMYVLKRVFNFSFVRTPIVSFGYFLLLALLISYLYLPFVQILLTPSLLSIVVAAGVLFLVNPLLYAYAKRKIKTKDVSSHSDLELLELDSRFIFSKIGDVFFQQLVTGVLLLTLHSYGIPFSLLVLVFSVVFSIGHLGLFSRMPRSWAYYFVLSALVGGICIPFVLLNTEGGFYYLVALHMLWYVVTGVWFRLSKHSKTFSQEPPKIPPRLNPLGL